METTVKERLIEFIASKKIPIQRFEKTIGAANGYVKSIRKSISQEKIGRITNAFPELNKSWLLFGEGPMLLPAVGNQSGTGTGATDGKADTEGIPFYDVDFTMGFDILEEDQTATPACYFNIRPYNRCTCWIRASGDSMMPTISPGDILAIKQVEDFRYLLSGEVYAIVTMGGLRTVKRIEDHGETLTLVPDNTAYQPQQIPKTEIRAVFQVCGSVRTF